MVVDAVGCMLSLSSRDGLDYFPFGALSEAWSSNYTAESCRLGADGIRLFFLWILLTSALRAMVKEH